MFESAGEGGVDFGAKLPAGDKADQVLAADARFSAARQGALKLFAEIKLEDSKIADIYLFAFDQPFLNIAYQGIENFICLCFRYFSPPINLPD